MVRKNNFIFTCILVLYISSNGQAETLLCSVCSSETDTDCEDHPPLPSPCRETEKTPSCQIVKKLDINGNILTFTRGCSTVSKSENSKGCLPSNNNITVCYEICHEDGCNPAPKPFISVSLFLTVVSVLLFVS